jgi:nicotinate phosphoribosyltransferase
MASRDLEDRLFWLATEPEIKSSKTTDIYFMNTKKVLDREQINTEVVMEVFVRELPYPDIWGVLTGVYEVAKLFEGLPVDPRQPEEPLRRGAFHGDLPLP